MPTGHESAPESPAKVFCVGLHKTSTTSLANALYTLGYHVGGFFDTIFFPDETELIEHVIEQATYYDAVQDMPWPEFYQLLDATFPGSKFILTVRDEDRWIRSVMDHFDDEYIDSHRRFYGVRVATGNEDVYREHFRRHNQDVIDYFADRPDDLLVMDITAGDGWDPLGAFLGVRTPDWPFPRANTMSGHRATRYQRHAKLALRRASTWTGLDRLLPGGAPVGALWAYPAMHTMFRDVDAVVASLDASMSDRERGRLEGAVRLWLQDLLSWASDVNAAVDTATVSGALDSWALDEAWSELRLGVRQWAADLSDYGAGARAGDASPASSSIRRALQLGDDHRARVDLVSGGSSEPSSSAPS